MDNIEKSELAVKIAKLSRREPCWVDVIHSTNQWRSFLRQRALKALQVKEKYNSLDTGRVHGSAFNIAFEESGKLCAVVFELAAFKLFDTRTLKNVNTVTAAHDGCVNCARFIEGNMLVTGSDDCTLAVWDIRKLGTKLCLLEGHRGWVKSIEYSRLNRALITGAFDKEVLVWDLQAANRDGALTNRPVTSVSFDKKVMRISYDDSSSRLVVANSKRLTVINDLNVNRPGLFTLKVAGVQTANANQSNRVYFINRTQFPKSSRRLWNISSLDMLPSFEGSASRCCVSRSTYLTSATNALFSSLRWLFDRGSQPDRQPATVRDAICVHDLDQPAGAGCNAYAGTLHYRNEDLSTSSVGNSSEDTLFDSTSTQCANKNRLLYTHSESALPSGYIKEISTSFNGRLIASPSGAAVNVYAFDSGLAPLDNWSVDQVRYIDQKRRKLVLAKTVSTASIGAVLCCRFAPMHEPSLLVTGSENGDVHFIDSVF